MFSGLENPLHLVLLLFLLLLLFGAKRLPEIGRSLGTGMREFKASITGQPEQTAVAQAPPVPELSAPTRVAESATEPESRPTDRG